MPEHPTYPPTLGAQFQEDGRCRFLVWAPNAEKLELKLLEPQERLLPMQPCGRGYYELTVDELAPGARYFYRIDGDRDRPDPASRLQPDGVHQASAAVTSNFNWTDGDWRGIPLHQFITYEMHVGTFSAEGTFEAVIPHLDELHDLGVTAIELMPCAQFPGGRNWGYDGVHPFAVQNTYGGPDGLKRLVDAAHSRGLAVIMDVVYNHIGPEGNYLAEFGHYFTDRHHTPWGRAINFDDRDSDEVRRFFIENALYWIDEFHIDALRLDAVHAIFDFTARPFLQELADAVRLEGERLNRRVYTIAESSLADSRLIMPKETGGCGIDGQWCDDLHHAIRTELTDEQSGYYADYTGFDDICKAYRDGFVQDGGYSRYRGRRHGNSARHVDPIKLVVCSQNHDQVGNRLMGERLTELASFEKLKLAAALVILSPCQPMLFMGEEYAESAPFQFFISHTDPDLVEAVRRGRKEEFARFEWQQEPPDPQDEATFQRCKLDHALKNGGRHRVLFEYYQELIKLRKAEPALAFPDRARMEVSELKPHRAMAVRRWSARREVLTLFHFGSETAEVAINLPEGAWNKALDSADARWNGPGSSLPDQIESSGTATLSLPPDSVTTYNR
ncbi:MAG: malto-oligosyltrehalose trehalohydrolase [Planctomycetota bacterium]|nr:MAG: malto-oligosyltrehalose trehalohydrolase [Planctomycetota bacterium]REK22140.1 MAG: malto-oligosyltrehalose trehalohydrolase [Planctomycetota bacterium]REK34972.1 MAG: malto-oligosyltrehalose trehalohydrolase [Planctomycetota bacterium]